MEHRMVSREFSPAPPRQDFLYFSRKTIPLERTPEVVHEQGATSEQIGAQRSDFSVAQAHVTRMFHVKERVLVYGRVREFQDTGIGISFDRGQLLEAVGEVQIGIGIIHPPAQPAPPAPVRIRVGIGLENDPCESEHVVLEAWWVSPLSTRSAVAAPLAC